MTLGGCIWKQIYGDMVIACIKQDLKHMGYMAVLLI